jgi:hypothetical protein
VINPSNQKLANFFSLLTESQIVYPENMTYILKRSGISYMNHNGERSEIYNRQKARVKVSARRVSEIAEQLSDLSLDDNSVEYSDYSEEPSYIRSITPMKDHFHSTNSRNDEVKSPENCILYAKAFRQM